MDKAKGEEEPKTYFTDVEILIHFAFLHDVYVKNKNSKLETLPQRLRHDRVKVDFTELLHDDIVREVIINGQMVQFPAFLRTKNSNSRFQIKEAAVCYYTARVGIASITVVLPDSHIEKDSDLIEISEKEKKTRKEPVELQTVMDLQLAMVEMKPPVILMVDEKNEIEVTTKEIFHALLDQEANGGDITKTRWSPDARFAKLFTFTRCLCPKPDTKYMMEKITYHIGAMSSKVRPVKEEVLEEFFAKNGYLRWAPEAWYCFHGYGGGLVQFGEARYSADLGTVWVGHSYMLEQVIHPTLFQRTFLSDMRVQINNLIQATEESNSLFKKNRLVAKLQDLHGQVLRFKARHWTGAISDSNANKELYSMWHDFIELKEIGRSVETGVAELATFYKDLAAEQQQARLDMLAIALGFIGLAGLVLEVVRGEDPLVSSSIVTFFCIAAAVFILLKPYITG